jgi:P2-related tail formation protein
VEIELQRSWHRPWMKVSCQLHTILFVLLPLLLLFTCLYYGFEQQVNNFCGYNITDISVSYVLWSPSTVEINFVMSNYPPYLQTVFSVPKWRTCHAVVRWGGSDGIDLAQNKEKWRALVNTVKNIRVSWNVGNFFSSCATGCFSTRSQLREVQLVNISLLKR